MCVCVCVCMSEYVHAFVGVSACLFEYTYPRARVCGF